MSLINKMLNDLDKRQTTTGEKQPLFGDVHHAPSRRLGSPVFIWVLIAVAAGFGALFGWSQFHKPSSAQAPVAQPIASETSAQPAEPPAIIQQAAKTEVVTTHKDAEVKPAETKQEVVAMTSKNATEKPAKATIEDKPKSRAGKESSFKVVSPQQQSDNLYLQAISLMQQSQDAEARDALIKSIHANPVNHNARLLLAILLADAGRNAEAEALLQEGLDLSPGHSDFSIKLARLQVADGAKDKALATLEQGLPKAGNNAEYHAFYAALLQNKGRHDDAIHQYITALRTNPSNPNWLIGVGISFKAMGKKNDAAEAFQRAIDTGELSAKVAQFADEQLKQLRQ
jgi:MSHA biogenesis protein MshN